VFEHPARRLARAVMMVSLKVCRKKLGSGSIQWDHSLGTVRRAARVDESFTVRIRTAGDRNIGAGLVAGLTADGVYAVVLENLEGFDRVDHHYIADVTDKKRTPCEGALHGYFFE
jgi:hypothetical protein